jgi:hypothetical protein
LELNRKLGGAADCLESGAIVFHDRVICESRPYFTKDIRRVSVRWFNQSIMNPLAVTSRLDYSRTTQISEVPGDFRLIYLQYFDEKADANFVVANEIDQSQTRVIGKRLEEKCNVVLFAGHAEFESQLEVKSLRFCRPHSSFCCSKFTPKNLHFLSGSCGSKAVPAN